MANGDDRQIKVSHLIALLKRMEWEAKYVRMALEQLDPATTLKPSPEIDEHLKTKVLVVDHITPPC